jgi:hypothetical protein
MKVVSLGWGIQSTTLAFMSALGDLPPIDAAIHADTTHERSATYAFAERWTPWLEAHGVHVITTRADANRLDRWKTSLMVTIPAFTWGAGDHIRGQMRRQCTDDWKRAPMRRWLQANRHGQPVEQWLGISLDEWQRARDSDRQYIGNRYPLIEMRMTRNDCANWLERHGLEVPSKSACVFCPFHNDQAWREMKCENGLDWQEAVRVDEAIRKARPPYDLFVNRHLLPLVDVNLSTPQDHGQLELWQEVCESGYCWT